MLTRKAFLFRATLMLQLRPHFTTIKPYPRQHPSSSRLLRCLLSTVAASAAAVGGGGPHLMRDYLITTFGFSPDKAAEVSSKHLTKIKSPIQPDAVVSFFKSHGFDDAQIKKIVSSNPRCLRHDVNRILTPKFHELHTFGFSPSDLPHLLVSSPDLLNYSFRRTLLPKLQLWRNLLGSHDLLIKLLKKEQWVLNGSLDRTILPNLTFLRECEIPDERIAMVVKNHPRFILQKPSMLRAQAKLVEGLGVSRSSPMFLWALQAVRMVSAESFKAKMEIMRKFGWSELDFRFAFRRAPVFLSVSEKMMAKKMEFLLKEVGCEPSYLALSPTLLMYSLEKRLIPRYRAMEVLKSRGLRGGNYKLQTIMDLPEKEFLEKFVLCHREAVPELYEMYLAGRHTND